MREWLLVPIVTVLTLTPAAAQDGAGEGRRLVLAVDPLMTVKEASARGTVMAQCGATGTTLRFELAGLVPEGTYSLWMFVFGGTSDVVTPADATAAGALGNGNGASHEFVADGSGRALLVLRQPAGRLSAFGVVRGCLLDETHWRVIGGYHPRRVTNGTSRPAEGEVVEYFGVRSTAALVTSTN